MGFLFNEFNVHDIIANEQTTEDYLNVALQLEMALVREEIEAGINRVQGENARLRVELNNVKKVIKSVFIGGLVCLAAIGVGFVLFK